MPAFVRDLLGLAVGSRRDALEAAVLRLDGIGLGAAVQVLQHARVRLPGEFLGSSQPDSQSEPRGDSAGLAIWRDAIRETIRQLGPGESLNLQRCLAIGLLISPRSAAILTTTRSDAFANLLADVVADQTGLTTIADFSLRDQVAGGSGQLIEAAADYLTYRHSLEERILIRLGPLSSIVWIPPGGKITEVIGLTAGPGHELLDEIVRLGTRGRESADPGGRKAVQGRFLAELQSRWLELPFLGCPPPRRVPASLFGPGFIACCFEQARELGATLSDLLCTMTHFIAGCVADAIYRWLPPAQKSRRIFLAGDGCRNGFLWKRLSTYFPEHPLELVDAGGVPHQASLATAAGILAMLTLDGVSGNLPLLTGASGGRLVGRIIPGELRNWAACAQWMARQTADYFALTRAA
jgi:anhydro-N-acetylmuramic acid kinase